MSMGGVAIRMIIQVEYTDGSFQRGTVDLDLPPQRDGNVAGFAPVVPKSIAKIITAKLGNQKQVKRWRVEAK